MKRKVGCVKKRVLSCENRSEKYYRNGVKTGAGCVKTGEKRVKIGVKIKNGVKIGAKRIMSGKIRYFRC